METTNQKRLRLRFYKNVNDSTDLVLKKFQDYKKSVHTDCILKIRDNHVFIDIPNETRKFWSPHLHLELEPHNENPEHTHIRGLFGPDQTLWTFFMFLHFIVGAVFVSFGGIAFSHSMLKQSTTMDFVIMGLMVVVWFLLYFIARQIRFNGYDQMNELEAKCYDIIRKQ